MVDLDAILGGGSSKKRIRDRQRAAAKTIDAPAGIKRRKSGPRPSRGGPGNQSRLIRDLVEVMEPGRWYGRPDLLALVGDRMSYGSLKMISQRLWMFGFADRAQNPDHVPIVYRKGKPITDLLVGRPPQWLYKLTAKGEAAKAKNIQ